MRNEHGTQSPCLCAKSESPEAIIKAIILTTGFQGSLVLFVFLSKTKVEVGERRDPLIYSAESYVCLMGQTKTCQVFKCGY